MEIGNWLFLYPEITLLFCASLILISTLYLPERLQNLQYNFSQISLILVGFFSVGLIPFVHRDLLNGLFVVDHLACVSKFFICLIGSMVFLYAKKSTINEKPMEGQYFVLCLFSMLGMMVVISASHFLSLYLGLELMVLPLYALISLDRKARSTEAAIKYFLLGALSSAFLLYGISLLYGLTGNLYLQPVMQAILSAPTLQPTLVGSLVFILIAVLFKLGVVPMHLWLPDIYEGSANPVTLFLGTLPKVAALIFATRLLGDVLPALLPLKNLLMISGLLCLLLGHLGALTQSNLKRMLAYSAIAQMGFVVLALMLGRDQGFAIALYYLFIYVIAALAFLGALTLVGDSSEGGRQGLEGLGRTNPWLGCLMIIILLSLVGIPPFAGFYAKLFVIQALIREGYLKVAVFALSLSVLAAFYYLKVIAELFFKTSMLEPRTISRTQMGLFSINSLSLLILGIFPAPLFLLCNSL